MREYGNAHELLTTVETEALARGRVRAAVVVFLDEGFCCVVVEDLCDLMRVCVNDLARVAPGVEALVPALVHEGSSLRAKAVLSASTIRWGWTSGLPCTFTPQLLAGSAPHVGQVTESALSRIFGRRDIRLSSDARSIRTARWR